MAKLLYAMEEQEIDQVEEMQTSPEEGEVADAQVEVEAEAADVTDIADAIETGDQASDELEEVEQVVEQAVEQGEGLDPVAAEAVRIAISAIAKKLGANPKAVYSLYATENFQSASARKGNTQIALEGVQEMLKDLWKKIKAALQKLWSKMKSLWEKHASATGRMVKAVASMKAKVKASSGKITGKAYLDKAPGALKSYFKNARDINAKVVSEGLFDLGVLEDIVASQNRVSAGISALAKSSLLNDNQKVKIGVEGILNNFNTQESTITLLGGEKVTFKPEVDFEEGEFKLEIEREPSEDSHDEQGMAVADKNTLITLLNNAETLIKGVAKFQKNSEKRAQDYNTTMVALEKMIQASNGKVYRKDAKEAGISNDGSAARKIMRVVYRSSTAAAKVESLAISESIRSCKAVLTYSAACLKQYK